MTFYLYGTSVSEKIHLFAERCIFLCYTIGKQKRAGGLLWKGMRLVLMWAARL